MKLNSQNGMKNFVIFLPLAVISIAFFSMNQTSERDVSGLVAEIQQLREQCKHERQQRAEEKAEAAKRANDIKGIKTTSATATSTSAIYQPEPRQVCDTPGLIDPAKATQAVKARETWMSDYRALSALGSPDISKERHSQFEYLAPITSLCPVNLSMFGGDKLMCVPDIWKINAPDGGQKGSQMTSTASMAVTPSCTVISIGSNNEWGFEIDFLRATGYKCKIHVFDCTVEGKIPPEIRDRVTYHKICIGSHEHSRAIQRTEKQHFYRTGYNAEFRTYHQICELAGLKRGERPTFFKMDVEGHEWPLLQSLSQQAEEDPAVYAQLPDQMVFEVHTQMAGFRLNPPRQNVEANLVVLGNLLYRLGYVLSGSVNNTYSGCCQDILIQRLFCSK